MTPEQIARGLSKAQRSFLKAASKRPKKWRTIRRDAKLHNIVRVHGMTHPLGLVAHTPDSWMRFAITPLGLAVRAYLESDHGNT